MGRIVFLNCFPKDQFSGGIKTTYHHAVCLKAQGFDVHVLQPEGPPTRLDDIRAQELVCQDIALDHGDVAVFPETLSGWFGEIIRAPLPAKKVIFCQNPYYFFWYCHSKEELEQWGVERIIVPSQWAKRSVQSVLGVEDVEVVQPSIDPELFVARDKKPRIVSAGWKWDGENHLPPYDRLIRKMLRRKYPAFTSIAWSALGEVSEQVVADTMGHATVCLSLGRLEALGMTALEAMSAECCVVGFHGGGGADYATAQNGFWHSPEDLEGVVDSLALALEMTENGGIVWQKMRQHGVATARRYHPEVTGKALSKVYSALFS